MQEHGTEGDDLYRVLNVSKNATGLEIRAAYRSLILQNHPDKSSTFSNDDSSLAARLNHAFSVLSDPVKRDAYDAALRMRAQSAERKNDKAFARSIDLSLFDAHYTGPESTAQERHDADPAYFSHPCRCSGLFIITNEQLQQGVEIVQCDSCSERCRVEYEAVIDDSGNAAT